MEYKRIEPINHPVDATVSVPGSKSLTNRALLIAALCNGRTHLRNALFSDDSIYFARALQELGFIVELNPENKSILVAGCNGLIPNKKARLFIGNAGTAARFLSAFLTLGDGEYTLDGDERMRERPLGDLVTSLNQLGASIAAAEELSKPGSESINSRSSICPPIKILASGLPGGKTEVSGDISSQYLSALLMVAPYAQSSIEIHVTTELNSKPYVDMTVNVMKDFGIDIVSDSYCKFSIQSARYQAKENYPIESDASAASYFFAAPAILGGSITINNISRKSTQGDIAFLDILQKMGCDVIENCNNIEVSFSQTRELSGVAVDMRDIPDTAQTLAAIAPFASSPTHIRGIASARVKESDRISATCSELARLGVEVEEFPDGMTIYPCKQFQPAIIKTYQDHRMAMAFSLIGLRVPWVSIENPGCVSKTFPEYYSVLDSLR